MKAPRVGIVGDPASETNRSLAAAWRGLGIDAVTLSPYGCTVELGTGDVALGRIDVRRTLDGVESGLLELLELRHRGVLVHNAPRALLRAHDKLLTARILVAAGVPHPVTEHVTAAHPMASLRPPVVVKPRFGSWGADVFRCDTAGLLAETLETIRDRRWFRRQGALVQELVPPVGSDLRVLVAAGQIVGALRRVAAPGEWRTNISLGGNGERAVPPPRARELAVAAARTVGADLVGVDLLPCGDDYVVIELNGCVDFDSGYSLEASDVFGEIAAALALLVPAAFS
jgi:RimK family alpha-L-glutamate ligase